MYTHTTIIQDRINEAREIINKNRERYDELMIIIENFIYENDIIVNNSNKYLYDLYTNDMYNLPKQLTNLLYESGNVLAKYTTLTVRIYRYSSRISINGIIFVYFTYMNHEISKNILPYNCPSHFITKEYKCFGPEIKLINIYTQLVNPLFIKDWPELYKQEKILANELIKSLQKRITAVEGGDNSSDQSIVIQLLNHFIDKSHVIIGQLATNIYKGFIDLSALNRIQLISQNNIKDDISSLTELFSQIKHSNHHLKVPTNLSLYKTSINIDQKFTLDIYNAANFEVVPYNTIIAIDNYQNIEIIYNDRPFLYNHELQIGTPFVIKRFRLIDIWSTLYLTQINVISKDNMNKIIYSLLSEFRTIHMLNITDTTLLFSYYYIGFYEDQMLKKERLTQKLKIKYIEPYMPYKFDK